MKNKEEFDVPRKVGENKIFFPVVDFYWIKIIFLDWFPLVLEPYDRKQTLENVNIIEHTRR